MEALRLTATEYLRFRASLPRGPFGPIWPTGVSRMVLIVEEVPTIPQTFIAAAVASAAHSRS